MFNLWTEDRLVYSLLVAMSSRMRDGTYEIEEWTAKYHIHHP
jgi:hypothetical protein